MRKSGWAAAAGLGSLVLLLTACGGSSGSSSTTSPTSTTTAQAAGQPTSGALAPGSVVLIVQKSALGYVLAAANGQVLYTYAKDTKGGTPTCTGSCATIWLPLTGNPVVSAGATGLGTLGTVSDPNGAKQVTYNGM
ncbi:MAG: COG4315 family predicted lipoprotein, partial [Streptosporangiaceae bacterium]